MRHVIEPKTHIRHGQGVFQIRRIRPGLGLPGGDTGFGPLGLVDRAHLSPGLVVAMHEHRDDEIVSYLRSGALTHTDSAGHSETIGRDRLMVMNAGAGFSHEERMPDGEDIHMLQIFVRPRAAGLTPAVQFATLREEDRSGRWRPLVGPDTDPGDAPATLRQDVHILDAHLRAGDDIAIPRWKGFDQWLYVFGGAVRVSDGTILSEGAAMAASADERIDTVEAAEDSDLILFEVRAGAGFTRAGSLSGGR